MIIKCWRRFVIFKVILVLFVPSKIERVTAKYSKQGSYECFSANKCPFVHRCETQKASFIFFAISISCFIFQRRAFIVPLERQLKRIMAPLSFLCAVNWTWHLFFHFNWGLKMSFVETNTSSTTWSSLLYHLFLWFNLLVALTYGSCPADSFSIIQNWGFVMLSI